MPKKNEIIIEDLITKIKLDDNSFCLVDTEDYLLFCNYFWRRNKNGYVESSIGLLHRVVTKCPNNKVVDHINHNILDNRKENLRVCTHTENNFNRLGANITSETGIRGISYDFKKNRYRAKFSFNNEHYDFGLFESLNTAQDFIQNARWAISNYSEIDNPNPSEELLKQKEFREKIQKQLKEERLKLPKCSIYCCGHTYSITNANDYKNFKCYLHKPTIKRKNYDFCLSYRFICPICGCVKVVVHTYSNFLKITNTHTYKPSLSAVNFLKRLQEEKLIIKELDLLGLLSFSIYGYTKMKGNSNWYYGVPINENLFKKVSFNGDIVEVVPVRTGKEFCLKTR